MLKNIFLKFFLTKHQREIKKIMPLVAKINNLEEEYKALTDEQIKQKSNEFKEQLASKKKTVNDLIAPAFALVREASTRVLGLRHYDVQLVGGVVLLDGKISEMKTGEGKTLVATLPAYLKALEGKGVHIVTVNDHLAKRDAEWMQPLYEFLGLTVGVVINAVDGEQRRDAYRCDITYGTNNEFGFDYLRDNMVGDIDEKSQRGHHYCIIDEVDSILIDEARTPLIISGPSESDTGKYYTIDKIIPRLKEAQRDANEQEVPGTGDYLIDIKDRNIFLTEDGVKKIENYLNVSNLYDANNVDILHHVNQALKAHKIFEKNKDYIVENSQVIIIDEFTGRKMEGRRFSDGLHQAIEAKERVTIQNENQTLASITLQNYFRLYTSMSGMTGTADTEAEEFYKIYKLDVVAIPPNKPVARKDEADLIYRSEKGKYDAILKFVKKAHEKGQPILLGTTSVENSEKLHKLFARNGLKHELLNAKNHERESLIVEHAGKYKGITIATNMAGRGTDIKLGEGVKEAGGLLVIGSERHESRRIDNQLRGRSGRQGDVGKSIFFISLEDELMKRFNSQKISGWMEKFGMKEDESLQAGMLTKMIENAQRKVEDYNFSIRKHLLEYDDVMNTQRQYIYDIRDQLLDKEGDLLEFILTAIEEVVEEKVIEVNISDKKTIDQEIFNSVISLLKNNYRLNFNLSFQELKDKSYDNFLDKLISFVEEKYKEKRIQIPKEILKSFESYVMLNKLDQKWKDHLLLMDHLRDGINLRSYGERKPIVEFKNEGYRIFKQMILSFKEDALESLFKIEVVEKAIPTRQQQIDNSNLPEMDDVNLKKKIGRNEPCPCGSGKKYKQCCLLKE